jgi:hypothetical protein
MPGVREGGDDGNEVGRGGKEEGIDIVPSQALDDAVNMSVTDAHSLGTIRCHYVGKKVVMEPLAVDP